MLSFFFYIYELKKELLIVGSLSLLYATYYLLEVVKKPLLICRKGEFQTLLMERVGALQSAYWPTPWCVNAHLQTVLGSMLRTLMLPPVEYRREMVALSDGGQVALDWVVPEAGAGAPVVVVLPGLTGGAHADYVRCVARAARSLRASLVVFNNRGLAGVPLTTPRLYCAVSHADVCEAVEHVARARPRARILAVGVSLGGLMLGQYLSAAGSDALFAAALIVSSPLDVVQASECIERPVLNAALSWHMARNLKRTVKAHSVLETSRAGADGKEAGRGGEEDWAAVEQARSLRQFDAAFTAPHFDFPDVDAYYRAATLADKLGHIRVPTLCLCAADDPFQPLSALPLREAAQSSHVALAVPARGGHIGFLQGWRPHAPHNQFLSRLVADYFSALLDAPHLLHRPPPPPPAPHAPHVPGTD